MKLHHAFVAVLCAFPAVTGGQDAEVGQPYEFGLSHLAECFGLTPEDIAFRRDYTEPDSFRLAVVADLTEAPLGMIDYASGLIDAHAVGQPEILASILYQDLAWEDRPTRSQPYRAEIAEIQRSYSLYYTNVALNQLLTKAAMYIDVVFPKSAETLTSMLSREERDFLQGPFKELIIIHEEEEFLPLEAVDSIEKAEESYCEQFVDFGYKIDRDPVVAAGVDCLREMVLEIDNLRQLLSTGSISVDDLVKNTGYLPENTDLKAYLGKQPGWKVGGPGNDYYRGDYKFIIDFGGDDVYDLSYDPDRPHGVIIVDLEGADRYRAGTDFALASGCFSVGLLLDYGGDDRYDAQSFALGSGFFGLGLLYDAAGDDRYDGDTHVQGAASYGLGILIDEGGRDVYNSALCSQGFALVGGVGIIYEREGSDTYYIGGKYKDVLRYEDHYLSLGQGFGYGLRPFISGGIGAIVDLGGNDTYYSDIFGQGSSYWWSLGVIYDYTGNDVYHSFQYAQGAATHMTLGILIDRQGHDVYFSKGVSQGCGHDYACGILLDHDGHDTYTAYDLSQAAGSANGVGILIDSKGEDRYFIKNAKNSQGYGNPRRQFGSIGLFADLGGNDQYAGNGRDNFYWRTDSKWGGGMDIEYKDPDSAEANE